MSTPPSAALPPPLHPSGPYRICLVCLGNICRSPMAEVALTAELASAGLADAVTVDSAGTGDWHIGHRMEAHARAELARRGYDGSAHRARQIEPSWLAGRDLILAMDGRNLADLHRMAARAGISADRIRLFGEAGGLHAQGRAEGGAQGGAERDALDIPDPYGGDAGDFSAVLDLIETAARHIAAQLTGMLAGRAPA
jgi:low molecular weight protein-tyrosine phosphatase